MAKLKLAEPTQRKPKDSLVPGNNRRRQVIGIGEDGYPDKDEQPSEIHFATTQASFDEEGWPVQRRVFR